MSEAKRIRVYCEGDDDRAVLKALQSGGILSRELELAKPSVGNQNLARDVAPFVSPDGVGGRAIVLCDLDNAQPADIGKWFLDSLKKQGIANIAVTTPEQPHARVTWMTTLGETRRGHVAVVPVGIDQPNELCKRYGLTQFAIDDYLLNLVHDALIYDRLSDVESISHALAMKKLTEVVELMRTNQMPVTTSKRALHLFRAVIGFRASPATFAERLLTKAIEALGTEAIEARMQPLVGDILWAVKQLQPG